MRTAYVLRASCQMYPIATLPPHTKEKKTNKRTSHDLSD
jgi:hypothetical protein